MGIAFGSWEGGVEEAEDAEIAIMGVVQPQKKPTACSGISLFLPY